MHERKAAMAREADGFIALPGNHLENSFCQFGNLRQTFLDILSFQKSVYDL